MGFTIHDGKRFAMDGASTTERVPTEFTLGKVYEYPFAKSGACGSNDPDAGFWRQFYAEKELLLPAGKYVLTAIVSFDLHEAIDDRAPYQGSVYNTITVEK